MNDEFIKYVFVVEKYEYENNSEKSIYAICKNGDSLVKLVNKILETDFVEMLRYIGNFFINNTNIDIPSINSNFDINSFKSSEKKIIIIQNLGDTLIKRSKTEKDMQVKKPKLKKRNDKGHIISLFKK